MSDGETVKPELPYFQPPPLEEVLRGLDSLDVPVDVQIPTLLDIDISFPTYRDFSALSPTSSSQPTYSTGLTKDISNSEHSFMTYATSHYPSLFDPALRDTICDSGHNYVDPQHNYVFSDLPMTLDSVGTRQLFPHYDHVVKVQPDDGLDRQSVGISPHCLSTAFQSPPSAVPIDPPVDGAPTTQVFTGPIRTKFTCLQCGHVFDRKSNLKSHMKTHDPNRERPFVCPESDCGYRFTRSHDLKRHRQNIHGGGASDLPSQLVSQMRHSVVRQVWNGPHLRKMDRESDHDDI